MSTANFVTMKNFPLWVKSDLDFCYLTLADNDEETDETYFDEFYQSCFIDDVTEELESLTENLTFFKCRVVSGYFTGLQILVEISKYADEAGFTENGGEYADDDSCDYYLDMTLAEAEKAFREEVIKVNEALETIGKSNDMTKIACIGVFSNGEAIYKTI